MAVLNVGELVSVFLEQCAADTAFGVISIHNMPILDAFARRRRMRFVPSRGEAGAVNMADACARVSGRLGVAVTSTGTGAGNAAGALVEAQTAGTPLLHITGQIESAYLDQNKAYIHEARDQLGMLAAVSKAAFRIRSANTAAGILKEALRLACTPPCGPVSIEIPIDIQRAETAIDPGDDLKPLPLVRPAASGAALDALAARLVDCRRPLLWLGGGARHAAPDAARLLALGFGAVSSTQGRGIVPENHEQSLGAFTLHAPVEEFYQSCDALLVAGSRLRSNETLQYALQLPRPLYQIDIDPTAQNRNYQADYFLCGDSAASLAALAGRLEGKLQIDPAFHSDLRAARQAAQALVMAGLGPYETLVDALRKYLPQNFNWVRDITLSNSIWGNRLPELMQPRAGVHALGGGIGQGLPMAIGAALANGENTKTIALLGDGGLMLCLGELATAVQEKLNLLLIVMNDGGYGVIRNIQDAHYGGRRCFVDLHTPDFATLANALSLDYFCLQDSGKTDAVIRQALAGSTPALLEVDMAKMGAFAKKFAGPPSRKSK